MVTDPSPSSPSPARDTPSRPAPNATATAAATTNDLSRCGLSGSAGGPGGGPAGAPRAAPARHCYAGEPGAQAPPPPHLSPARGRAPAGGLRRSRHEPLGNILVL